MSEDQNVNQSNQAEPRPKKGSKANIIIALAAVIVIGGAAYGLGLFKFVCNLPGSGKQLKPAFFKSQEMLFSKDEIMSNIGVTPAEQAKASGGEENTDLSEIDKKPEFCPPNPIAEVPADTKTEQSPPLPAIQAETPLVKKSLSDPARMAEATNQMPKSDSSQKPLETSVPNPSVGSEKKSESSNEPSKPADKPKPAESNVSAGTTSKIVTPAVKPEPEASAKQNEEFQLPGSLTLKIQGYSGTVMKWHLMVIYDDSLPFGKKTKSSKTSKHQIVESFISKLPSTLTPGSKLAVRDFHCGKSEGKNDYACLSRMVFGWADSPFNDLQNKLADIKPGGKNNPCAAAAYSLRKDFTSVSADASPRILIITDGTAKCASADVLKAIEEHKDRNKIVIDLLLMGNQKKKHDGYTALVKRTGGQIFKLDNAHDVEAAVAKYAKLLKARTMEKIEVRGDKTIYTAVPEEELTLAPGIYEITLPLVAGITASNRKLQQVKIGSGEAKVLEVKIRKGKPAVKGMK